MAAVIDRVFVRVVGTARCAVRAALSGATRWANRLPSAVVPPAGRGRGHRSAMSLPLNAYETVGYCRTLLRS